MQTQFGTIPSLRHTDQVARKTASRLDIEVTNVAVRVEDRAAFLAIIAEREAQILNADPARSMAGKALEAATSAHAATEALTTDCPPDLAIAHLETVAAITIGLLADLKGKA